MRPVESLEEYLERCRLDEMKATLVPYDEGYQVIEIASKRILGVGIDKEEALNSTALVIQEEELVADQPSRPLDDLDKECLMPLDEWLSCVECGGFIDYDGDGHLATKTHRGNAVLYPSYAAAKRPIPKWATHVCWYNK